MNILILSRSSALYSTQSLLRACYRRGHQTRVVDHLSCDLVIDENDLKVYCQGELLQGFDAVIPRIGSSVTNYGTAVIRHFERMGIFTVTRADSIIKARNKLQCFQILATEGIPVPKTLLPNFILFDEDLARQYFDLPVVIKLLESTHGLGVILSETYKNAASTVEAFYRMKHKVLMQEYVKESAGQDIRAFVVDDEIVASMKRQAQDGEFRSNLHRGATASFEPLTEREKFLVRKSARLMGLSVAGVDILRSKHGPKILEVNSSPGLEGIEAVSGVDIAGYIIRFVERKVRKRNRYLMKKG